MLPGYADVSVREDVLIEAQRVDSLEILTQHNERQLLIIKNIIADNIKLDSITTIDSTDIEKLAKEVGENPAEAYGLIVKLRRDFSNQIRRIGENAA